MSENSPSSRSERVPFARPVHVTPLDCSEQPLRLVGGNLSRTGMFLRSNLLLPAGTKVSLAFEAKGQPLPFAEAEVIWQRAPTADGGTAGFALRFTRFLNQRGPELVEQLVSLGRNKLAEAEAKLAREAAPGPALHEEEAPTVQAAARPPPVPLDATPPEPPPSVRPAPAGKQPAFVKPTGPLSVGVPRPVSPLDAAESEDDAAGEEVSLHEFEGSSSLRGTKLRGPSAGALALLVAVPLVIAVAAWRASTTSEPALAVLEKPANPPAPAAAAAPAPTPALPEAPKAAAAEPGPVVKELPPAPAMPQPPVMVAQAAPAARAPQPVAAAPQPAPTPAEPTQAAPPVEPPVPAVARAEKPERSEKPTEKPAPREKVSATGIIKLGQGAVTSTSLKGGTQKLELDLDLVRGARIRRAFALKGPHRLVVDVEGGRDAKSLERSVSQVPGVTRARVGPQPGGVTRLVLDLTRAAGKVTHGGDRVSVTW
jgi:hypothetical protein